MRTKKTQRSIAASSYEHPCTLPLENGLCQTGSDITIRKGQTTAPGSRICAQNLLDLLSPTKIVVVTMAFRILHVLDRNNWWLVHPDEVYQSVEIGHIEAFGYGFRSYEFSPPDGFANDTRYQRLLLDANLAGLRSPLFPYFYTWVFFISFQLGITANPYLISRVAHVIMTSLLPAAVYYYANNHFHSRDTGIIAAITTASSVHMNVFGVRCFLQSFLAPITFAALNLVLRITEIRPLGGVDTKQKDRNQSSSFHPLGSTLISTRGARQNISLRQPSSKTNDHLDSCSRLRHVVSEKDRRKHKMVNVGTHCTSEHNGCTAHNVKAENFTKDCFGIGCLIGLASYVRPDVLLVHVINLLILLQNGRKKRLFERLPMIFLGFFISLSVGLLADRIYYERWVISPLNWIQANVYSDFSTGIFGKMYPWFYVYNFTSQDPLTSILCGLFVSLFVIFYLRQNSFIHSHIEDKGENNKNSPNQCLRLLLGCAVFFISFSLHGHKEMRFIHDAIVLLQIFISGAICHIAERTAGTFRIKKEHIKLVSIVAVLLLQRLQHPGYGDNDNWAYQKSKDTHSTNACLEYVSRQKDVRGIFLDTSFFMTGGMTILHHDIPVLSLLLDGFFEFGFDSRLNSSSSNPIFPMKKRYFKPPSLVRDNNITSGSQYSINSFTRATNYISHANAPAVVKIILENRNYNYLILRKDRRFLDIGFEEVFRFGNQRVIRRNLDATSEMQLNHFNERISLGNNATVLLHEGDVLAYMGMCQVAVGRFEACLAIQPDLIAAYLPLHSCLLKLGRKEEASEVLATCFKMSTKEECRAARPLTRIY